MVEPLLYGLTHADGERDDNSYETAEAGVFFAATIPFVFVLVLGLAGIALLNDRIGRVPAAMEQHQVGGWTMVEQVAFDRRWEEMAIGELRHSDRSGHSSLGHYFAVFP